LKKGRHSHQTDTRNRVIRPRNPWHLPRSLAQQHVVSVNVPFDLAVGQKLLPADTYNLTALIPGTVAVQRVDKPFIARIVASHGTYQTTGASTIVFA
jgi:hypothetical protein